MDRICEYKDCTGCELCTAVCPKSCISMKEMQLGHLYPVIDASSCVDCGRCAEICPANTCRKGMTEDLFREPVSAWAAWAKDRAEYISSSSGGAAAVLSGYVISEGGIVYGSAVCRGDSQSGKSFTVNHIRVSTPEGLHALKGSKYVQSSISEILPAVRNDVREGRLTLFTGTPCQIAAVRNMFGTVPDNLLLVDIICHGVPSMKLLRDYVERNLHISPEKVSGMTFRTGGNFAMKIATENSEYSHTPLSGRRTEELYYNLFLDGFIYRDSCYRCPFARRQRISDMTVGDFWGLGKDVPEHPYGVSLLLPVTEKGERILARLREKMNSYQRSVDEAAAGNKQLRAPFHKSLRIKLFRAIEPLFGLKVYYLLVADWILRKHV